MSTRTLVVLGALALQSCAPSQTPETAASEPSGGAAAPAEPSESSEAPAVATAPPESAEAAAAAPPENQPSVIDICLKRCERLSSTCSKTSLDACKADCGQWKTLPTGCESQIRAAVECMTNAPDAQCANIAPPSCAKQFRTFTRCKEGNPEPEAETAKAGSDAAGLSPFEDAAGGFKVLMPGKPQGKDQDGHRVWIATNPEGVSYEVHKLPALTGKLSPKVFVKTMTSFLGPCAAKMRLHGMIDTPNYTLMRFETRCSDSVEWRGAIHAHKNATYVLGLKGPAVKQGQAEAFLGSFQAT